MKPHEETWTFEMSSSVGCRVMFPTREGAINSGLILGGVPNSEDKEAVCRLIAASPEMARALLEALDLLEGIREGSYKVDTFTDQPIRAALAKAGVPLP